MRLFRLDDLLLKTASLSGVLVQLRISGVESVASVAAMMSAILQLMP